MTMRVLIVDDEPLARDGVAIRLARHPEFAIVGQSASGAEAIGMVRSLQPDLLFLDIQMPDMTGIEVLRAIDPERMPHTIFLTAFAQYAVAAFEVEALDYLLKPLDDERFEAALRRVGRQNQLKVQGAFQERAIELLRSQENLTRKKGTPFAVRRSGQLIFIQAADIDWVGGNGDYANLHVRDKTYILRQSLHSLDEKLSSMDFVRVHRSAIVQIDRIRHVRSLPNRDCELTLADGTELRSSRTYSNELWAVLRKMGI